MLVVMEQSEREELRADLRQIVEAAIEDSKSRIAIIMEKHSIDKTNFREKAEKG